MFFITIIASSFSRKIIIVLPFLFGISFNSTADEKHPPSVTVDLPVSTQGPAWPPSEFVDKEGNFILVGYRLKLVDGVTRMIPNQAVLVSKNTRPPFDEAGNKVLDNWILSEYDVIRPLDLSPESEDLKMVLHSLSAGPSDEYGIRRIPSSEDSAYNLTLNKSLCPELFPTQDQLLMHRRKSYPLHRVPINGFQGDNVEYDITTGIQFDPKNRSGEGCLQGCSGEDKTDYFPRSEPITLGDWLSAKGKVKISLTDYSESTGNYTAANFIFRFKHAIPNAVYTVWTIRINRFPLPGSGFVRRGDPLGIPNIIVTDKNGDATVTTKEINPFPDPEKDKNGERVVGIVVAFHSDYQTWGACVSRLGFGVDVHAQFNTMANGSFSLTDFVTVKP